MPREQRRPKQPHGAAPGGAAGASSGRGGGKPFNEKIDEIVTKVVPQKWLGTAFGGAAVGAFLFFVFFILALALAGGKTPEEAQAQIDSLKGDLKTQAADFRKEIGEIRDKQKVQLDTQAEKNKKAIETERKAHDATTAQLKDARLKSKQFESKAARTEKAEENLTKARKEATDLKAQIKQQSTDIRKLRETEKRMAAVENREKEAKLDLAKLRKEHEDLKAEKGRKAELEAQAEATFKDIMTTVANIDDPVKRVAKLRELYDARGADFAGTAYEERMRKHVASAELAVEKQKRAATAKKKRSEESEFKAARKRAEATKDYDRKIAILSEAAETLAGTPFGEKLNQQVKELKATQTRVTAATIHREVMAKVTKKENRTKYRENLEALREALAKIEDKGYAARLEKEIKKRSASVELDVARGALEGLNRQIKQNPKKHQDNIAAAQAALAEAGETRYKAQIERILQAQTAKLEDATGQQSYQAAVQQLKSSKDAAGNVTVLEGLKARCAEGSSWARKIETMLKGQRKKAAREQPN